MSNKTTLTSKENALVEGEKFTTAWLNIDKFPGGMMMSSHGGRFGPVPAMTGCLITTSATTVEEWRLKGMSVIEVQLRNAPETNSCAKFRIGDDVVVTRWHAPAKVKGFIYELEEPFQYPERERDLSPPAQKASEQRTAAEEWENAKAVMSGEMPPCECTLRDKAPSAYHNAKCPRYVADKL